VIDLWLSGSGMLATWVRGGHAGSIKVPVTTGAGCVHQNLVRPRCGCSRMTVVAASRPWCPRLRSV